MDYFQHTILFYFPLFLQLGTEFNEFDLGRWNTFRGFKYLSAITDSNHVLEQSLDLALIKSGT